GDRVRDPPALSGGDEPRLHLLRHLSLHEVLRLVVGLDAEVPLLPDPGSGRPRPAAAPQAAAVAQPADGVMRRAGLLSALALIVVTNAIVLAGVLSNRRGEPDAILTLTERELPLGWVE